MLTILRSGRSTLKLFKGARLRIRSSSPKEILGMASVERIERGHRKPIINGCVICSKCGELKPLEMFDRQTYKKNGRRPSCKTCQAAYMKEWYKVNYRPGTSKGYNKEERRVRHRMLRQEVLTAYGSACACCGESTAEFLCIDHINNNGAKERRESKRVRGSKFYSLLKQRGFPKDNYQLLCHNCNFAKARYAFCPHLIGKKIPQNLKGAHSDYSPQTSSI
jgi:hypothetical protein